MSNLTSIDEIKSLQKLLQVEKEHGLQQYNESLNNQSVSQRRQAGVTWYPIQVAETGYGLGDYPWAIIERDAAKGHSGRFRGGSMVEFFSNQDSDEPQTCRGSVHWVDGQRMKVTLFDNEMPDWLDDGKVGINLLFDTNSFKEMELALQRLVEAERNRAAELREILLGYKEPAFDKRHHTIELPQLNAAQNAAVNSILAAEDVALVHGPPGTGKTTTLVAAIQQLAKTTDHMLVCAPSNAAADLLTERIADAGVSVVRVGNLSRIDEAVMHRTLEHLLTTHQQYATVKQYKRQAADFRQMAGKYKRKFGAAERQQRKLLYREAREVGQEAVNIENHVIDTLLDSTKVVVCTLVGAQHRYLRHRDFRIAIVDEAAQALEPATWIPVLKAQKVVFAGDPFQLPPTILSSKAAREGLSSTLMEKGMKRLNVDTLLDTQYRMNATIMGFSNTRFYGDNLVAHQSVIDHTIDVPSGRTQALEFIDTAGCGFEETQNPETRSLFNAEEARILLTHLETCFAGVDPANAPTIGIISPYKEQVLHLREAAKEHPFTANITINTIDAFQGQEREVIYLSMVRSNDRSEIGFLSDYRRMNVAMTRAQKKLVIVGDSATLGGDKFYQQFLDYCEQAESYLSAWEFM